MRAVIYARYSPGPKQTELSIEGQVRECKKYIESKGYDLIEVYADRHVTGMSLKNRDEFARLMDDARAHKFEIVICYDTARFARSKYDAVVNKTELRRDLGIEVEYATLNAEGPEGRLIESVMEGFNQYYSEELSRKVKRGMYDAAMRGQVLGARPALGYAVGPDRKYIIDETGAAAVRSVFESYLNGSRFCDCARDLNDAGYRTTTGKEFSGSTVRRMLENTKYIGMYMGERDKVPRIVSDELFYSVQKKLGETTRHAPRGPFPLVGKLVCGCCGAQMTGSSGTSKTGRLYYYYKCPNKCKGQKIRQDKLDAYVAEYTRELFSEPQTLNEIAHRLFTHQEAENASGELQASLEANLARTERALDNVALALAERPQSKTLLKKLDDLEIQAHDIEINLNKERLKKTSLLSEDMLRAGLAAFIRGFEFDKADKQDRRLIDALIDTVVLHPTKILTTYTINGIKDLEQVEFARIDTSSTNLKNVRTLLFASGGFAVCCPRTM